MKLNEKHILMILLLLLVLLVVSCKKADLPDITADEVIEKLYYQSSQELRADGVSQATLIARIPSDATKKTITFKTNSGSFYGTNGATSINIIAFKGEARAMLIVGRIEQDVVISAEIAGYQKTLEINLKRAFADTLIGETSTLVVKKDGSQRADLKAILSRDVGKVSIGTPVIFRALQSDALGNPVQVGRFLGIENSKTDENGIAKITFSADTGNVTVGAVITIEMETDKDDGSKLVYRIHLNVI